MAHYIIEKLSDRMYGEGDKLFPRLVDGQMIDTDRIADIIEQRTSFTRGDVVGVLAELAAVVEEKITEGNSVKIDGLGTMRPVLGLVEKQRRGDWTDSKSRLTTGHNVKLKAVRFRTDSKLLNKVGSNMSLERTTDRMGRNQPSTTIEERTAAARQYLSEHGFMRVANYAALTGLAHSTAGQELRRLAADSTSGIISTGNGSSKIYIAK